MATNEEVVKEVYGRLGNLELTAKAVGYTLESVKEVLGLIPLYHIGQRFIYETETYILATVSSTNIQMINLITGNRYKEAIKVKNFHKINKEQLFSVCNENFKPIEVK